MLPLLIHGDAAFAGQGVVAETLNLRDDQGLPRRRHDPPRHQQPARLHHAARVGPLVGVLHRRRQDGAGADLPRERRRPRGVRPGGPAGLRLPPAVPQGRRDRHGLLPAPRPQRGRRPELHAAAHVQADRRPPLGAQALHRGARQAGRHHDRGGRAGARRLPGPAAGGARARPGRAPPEGHRGPRRRRRRSACCPTSTTGVDRDDARRASTTRCRRRPRASPSTRSWPSSSRPATKMFARRARSTGRSAEALAFGSLLLEGTDIRLAGQDTRRGTFSPAPRRARRLRDRRRVRARWPTSTPTRRKFWIYDSLLSRVRRARLRVRLLGRQQGRARARGRRSSATSSTAPRSSSTSTSSPPRTSGARPSGLVLLLPARLRGPGPRALARPASSGSSRCAPRTTSRSPTPRPRRSTSTCCAARCAATVRKPLSSSRPSRCCGPSRPARRSRSSPTGSFQEVLDDPTCAGDPAAVQRVVLGSGKVGLRRHRRGATSRARRSPVLRVEQLYPWPVRAPRRGARRAYPNAAELVWLQEEPENMGPWNFVKGRLYEALGDRLTIKRVSRFESGSPGHRLQGHPRPGAGDDPGQALTLA